MLIGSIGAAFNHINIACINVPKLVLDRYIAIFKLLRVFLQD